MQGQAGRMGVRVIRVSVFYQQQKPVHVGETSHVGLNWAGSNRAVHMRRVPAISVPQQ
jgi:hypothetical protein